MVSFVPPIRSHTRIRPNASLLATPLHLAFGPPSVVRIEAYTRSPPTRETTRTRDHRKTRVLSIRIRITMLNLRRKGRVETTADPPILAVKLAPSCSPGLVMGNQRPLTLAGNHIETRNRNHLHGSITRQTNPTASRSTSMSGHSRMTTNVLSCRLFVRGLCNGLRVCSER